jgi:hypothetical protein
MRFPKALTCFILAITLVITLPAWAQPRFVAPTFRSAPADTAASLLRHGSVKPPLPNADLRGGSTTASPPASAKKPINHVKFFAPPTGQAARRLCFKSFLRACTDGAYS